jgi:magnesium-transporting ATPase (P-type)
VKGKLLGLWSIIDRHILIRSPSVGANHKLDFTSTSDSFTLVPMIASQSTSNKLLVPSLSGIGADVDIKISQTVLDSLNEHEASTNRENLDRLGGVEGLAKQLSVSLARGLTSAQVLSMREKFGSNIFPAAPFNSYLELLLGALSDATLQILLVAAAVSFGIGYWHDPEAGWIDGAAIFVAVFLVSNIAASNDYSKELQFLALEKASQKDERASVLRNGVIDRVNPTDIVVGDVIVLQVNMIVFDNIDILYHHYKLSIRLETRFRPTPSSLT